MPQRDCRCRCSCKVGQVSFVGAGLVVLKGHLGLQELHQATFYCYVCSASESGILILAIAGALQPF